MVTLSGAYSKWSTGFANSSLLKAKAGVGGGGWVTKITNSLMMMKYEFIFCYISKQRMSQSSAIADTMDSELVSPEGTQKRKNTCHQIAATPYSEP